MPIYWNIEPHMARRGIPNANQLADKAGLTLPLAYRLLNGHRVYRIDTDALEKLSAFFRCSPWRLLRHSKSGG